MKTGNKRIESKLRKRWILFAGVMARIEDTRFAEVGDGWKPLEGGQTTSAAGKGKERMGYLRVFGIKIGQWRISVQDVHDKLS